MAGTKVMLNRINAIRAHLDALEPFVRGYVRPNLEGFVLAPLSSREVPGLSASVIRSFEILRVLNEAGEPMRISEIADLLDLQAGKKGLWSRSTVHRYLTTLVLIKQVKQIDDRRYEIFRPKTR